MWSETIRIHSTGWCERVERDLLNSAIGQGVFLPIVPPDAPDEPVAPVEPDDPGDAEAEATYVAAMEQYAGLRQGYELMVAQREDGIASQQPFWDACASVREQLAQSDEGSFTITLHGDGTADLVLEVPPDPDEVERLRVADEERQRLVQLQAAIDTAVIQRVVQIEAAKVLAAMYPEGDE